MESGPDYDELRRRYGSGGGCPFNQDSLLPPNPSRAAPTLSGRASISHSAGGDSESLSKTSGHVDEENRALGDTGQVGDNKAEKTGLTYMEYLRLDRLLSAQALQSEVYGNPVPDEHLFIITHQAYELWFKQIIFDLDIIRALFDSPTQTVDESKMLKIVQGLERIVRIFKLLVDQMLILETMSPLDFLEFRNYLAPASGFQSLQFRLVENKLGVASERRVKYNAQHYRNVFRRQEDVNELYDSEVEPSLLQLVDKWLSRTPGVCAADSDNSDASAGFWSRYVRCVQRYLADLRAETEKMEQADSRTLALHEWEKIEKSFGTLLNECEHDELVAKGERRLSHKAMQGAMLIYFYRDQPRFSQPYLILTYLMDIDSLITKWRYNHVMLVQRQLGTKQGTGGSSGYMYLRSTISDRYKVFLDLFNLSTWIIPRAYVPELSERLARKLTVCDHDDDEHNAAVAAGGGAGALGTNDDDRAANGY